MILKQSQHRRPYRGGRSFYRCAWSVRHVERLKDGTEGQIEHFVVSAQNVTNYIMRQMQSSVGPVVVIFRRATLVVDLQQSFHKISSPYLTSQIATRDSHREVDDSCPWISVAVLFSRVRFGLGIIRVEVDRVGHLLKEFRSRLDVASSSYKDRPNVGIFFKQCAEKDRFQRQTVDGGSLVLDSRKDSLSRSR